MVVMLRKLRITLVTLLAWSVGGQELGAQEHRDLIVGGVEAGVDEFPYFVLLEGEYTCGGVLISENRVLTAGTCIQDNYPQSVRVGATTRSNGQHVNVECVVRHPKFEMLQDPYTIIADLAVLFLEKNITDIRPVTLNNNIYYPNEKNQFLQTMGFGRTSSGVQSQRLMKLETTLRKLDDCASVYPQAVIQDRQHICSDIPGGGGCSGDQGGPLVDGNGVLVGVVSFSYGCASNLYYDVASHAGAYYSWIRDQVYYAQCPNAKGAPSPSPTPFPTNCVFGGHFLGVKQGIVERIREGAGALRGTATDVGEFFQNLRPLKYNKDVQGEEAPWELASTPGGER